jgi:hypothetical protein
MLLFFLSAGRKAGASRPLPYLEPAELPSNPTWHADQDHPRAQPKRTKPKPTALTSRIVVARSPAEIERAKRRAGIQGGQPDAA